MSRIWWKGDLWINPDWWTNVSVRMIPTKASSRKERSWEKNSRNFMPLDLCWTISQIRYHLPAVARSLHGVTPLKVARQTARELLDILLRLAEF
jgi:hypothetical protein